MSTIPQMLETPAPFRAWLEQQPQQRRFKARSICRCPLAGFIREAYPRATVGSDNVITPDKDAVFYGLPYWGKLFVRRFDEHHRFPTSRKLALAILAEVERSL